MKFLIKMNIYYDEAEYFNVYQIRSLKLHFKNIRKDKSCKPFDAM